MVLVAFPAARCGVPETRVQATGMAGTVPLLLGSLLAPATGLAGEGRATMSAGWRKSAHSEAGNHAEASDDWRKSTHSPTCQCVEVAAGIRIRDTASRGGTVLTVSDAAWRAFTRRLSARS